MSDPVLEALRAVVARQDLPPALMEEVMERVLAGEVEPAQLAGLAVGLRMKGESTDELVSAAKVLRRHAAPFETALEGPLLDTCGTGGDGAGTFNISTTAAIVVAACGARVAKHGNRAVSSKSGSADVLEALGVRLTEAGPEAAADLEDVGIAFFFAPAFHRAVRHAVPVRRALKLRTFFNLLGPLANPARASHQLLGVYDGSRIEALAEVLHGLGVERAWVVHGRSGLDEVDPSGPTDVAVLHGGEVTRRVLEPRDFGLDPVPLSAIEGGDAQTNAGITRSVLDGEPGPARTATVLNAAAALCVLDPDLTPEAAALCVGEALDHGRAASVLARWVARGSTA